jgi:hypothetical protein
LPDSQQLRILILNAMMDDAEDIEQIYIAINSERLQTGGQPEIFLRDIMDEIPAMLGEGLIKAEFSNDSKIAPLDRVNIRLLHYYWFSPTEGGKTLWSKGKEILPS